MPDEDDGNRVDEPDVSLGGLFNQKNFKICL